MTPARDRFEKMVREEVGKFSKDYCELEQLDGEELCYRMTKMMKREHAALVRAVTRLRCVECTNTTPTEQCLVRKQAVLALLAGRKGRKG